MTDQPRQPIRAADYLVPEDATPLGEAVYPPNREGLVLRLFGTLPDYRREEIAAIWRETGTADPFDLYDYCRRRGVEVLDDTGEPVPGWRDIATTLIADERGLLAREDAA